MCTCSHCSRPAQRVRVPLLGVMLVTTAAHPCESAAFSCYRVYLLPATENCIQCASAALQCDPDRQGSQCESVALSYYCMSLLPLQQVGA